jgi:hypothetical protein
MEISFKRSNFAGVGIGLLSMCLGSAVNALALGGQSVTGELISPVTGSINYFDPTRGFVPPGFGNSSSATATISEGMIEFGFLQGGGTIEVPGINSWVVDFKGDLINVRSIISPSWLTFGLAGVEIRLTSVAFAGLTLSELSDTFGNGGFASSLSGNTISMVVGPACAVTTSCVWPALQEAQFRLAGDSPGIVPEPGVLALLLAGIAGAGGFSRRRLA